MRRVRPRRLRRHWFLPATPDVVGLLGAQARITVEGFDALVAWASGAAEQENAVREAEHRADDARRELQTELRRAFSTPLEPEDIYSLSERLDAVLNGAKNLVRESEVMDLGPDDAQAEMARRARDGVVHLADALGSLVSDPDWALSRADAAIASQRDIERSYRTAMSALLTESDVRVLMGRRELYRRHARLGDGIVRVAERVWYALVKEA